MNRLLAVITVVSMAATTFSADNQWDGNNFGYNGAFGLADKSSPNWSTATDIWTIRTPLPGDTPSGALGYLSVLNVQNTQITLTNSFTGQLAINNGGPPAGPTAKSVTNRVISVDQGVSVIGALSGVNGGTSANPSTAINVTASPFGSDDVLILEEGHYVGGAGQNAVLIGGAALVSIQGTQIDGGKGASAATAADSVSFGGAGVFVNGVTKFVIDSSQAPSDAIRGGDGGDALNGFLDFNVTAYGGVGLIRFLNNGLFVVENGRIEGGNGGNIVSSDKDFGFNVNGGVALNSNGGSVDLKQGLFLGGNGGDVQLKSANAVSKSVGGSGVILAGNVSDSRLGAVVVQGGAGGEVTSSGAVNGVNLSGGSGMIITNVTGTVSLRGASVTGGNGGILKSASSSGVVAKGGAGLLLYGNGTTTIGPISIDGGAFTGGSGGTISDSTGSADVAAGRGAFIKGVTARIGGNAAFTGGNSGTFNGTAGNQAVALEIQDANVTITNGTFVGRKGLLSSTAGGNNNIAVLGGNLGDVEFGGTDTIGITGGLIDELLISGAGNKGLTLGGTAKYGDLYFYGTGNNSVSISNAVTSSGVVMQSGGKTTVNLWNNGNFVNTTLSGGSMSFNGRSFDLQSGNQFVMGGADTRARFNGGLTVKSGSTLDVGLGQVTAPTLSASAGSNLRTGFSDETGPLQTGLVTGDDLTFNNGLTWTLYGSAAALENIKLASASNSLTSTISASNIKLLNNPEWIQGINGVITNEEAGVFNLYASYGVLAINDALDAGGNLQFEKALNALDTLMLPFNRNLVSSWSKGEAEYNLYNGYVRTPEMANTLIRLQSVFNDQIKDRTRSYLRFKNWGTSAFHAPQGAAGPQFWYEDSKAWLNDHLPTWDAQGDMRRAADNLPEPSLSQEKPVAQKPFVANSGNSKKEYNGFVEWYQSWLPTASADEIKLPATYQVWGRGYGASMKQDRADQHEGYDASIGGAVVGLDKRFNNLLLGLGGGAAHSSVDGKGADNDGSADTVNAVAYAAMNGERSFIDANINYAYSSVETDGIDALAYTGKYDAQAVSMYLGGGLAFTAFKDSVLFTPEASLLTTYYDRESFTESSELLFPAKNWDSYDQWSYLSSVGATLSMIRQIEAFNIEMEFQPEIRAHWLHEFNNDMDDPTYSMIPGSNIGVDLQAREEDLVKVGAGLRFSKWASDTLEFGLDVDGTFGDDYTEYAVSGKLMHRF